MKTLAERLVKILEEKRMSQEELAGMIGASQAAISKIILGTTKRSKLIPLIASALGVSEQYLMYGSEPNAEILTQGVQEWDSDTVIPDDMVAIPYFNGSSLSAGTGAINSDIPYTGASLWYAKSFIKRKGTCPEKVFCIGVKGDSMTPVFDEGGVVMIDTLADNIYPIIDGKPYAIHYDNGDYIKFLRKLPNNRIRVVSANPEYETFDVDAEEILIVGKVIEYAKEW